MREIKFRAWDKENNSMVYSASAIARLLTSGDILNCYETIMQFTGLKDKNGKDVYEGDVFGELRVGEKDEPIGIVEFDTDFGAFVINKFNGGWEYLHQHFSESISVVIGNIHENPDLLTEKS